jgi:cytidylate kinase
MAQKSDRRRAAYLRDNYDIDWSDVALYHLILNTAHTPREASARVIADAVARISTG